MALVKCPECGHEVSDRAASCPKCACPLSATGEKVEVTSGLLGQRGTFFGAANFGCAGCLVVILAFLLLYAL